MFEAILTPPMSHSTVTCYETLQSGEFKALARADEKVRPQGRRRSPEARCHDAPRLWVAIGRPDNPDTDHQAPAPRAAPAQRGQPTDSRAGYERPAVEEEAREEDEATTKGWRELRKQYPDSGRVFVTERGSPLSQSVVRHIVKRAGKWAKIAFPVHPHQLRHACGYHLANRPTDTRTIQAYLGHRNIQHTIRYTELASDRFNGLFD